MSGGIVGDSENAGTGVFLEDYSLSRDLEAASNLKGPDV
jgi:hypothetical protein